jgi:hypothetical protein
VAEKCSDKGFTSPGRAVAALITPLLSKVRTINEGLAGFHCAIPGIVPRLVSARYEFPLALKI